MALEPESHAEYSPEVTTCDLTQADITDLRSLAQATRESFTKASHNTPRIFGCQECARTFKIAALAEVIRQTGGGNG